MKRYFTICCLTVLPIALAAQPSFDTALQRYGRWLQAHDTASSNTVAKWVKALDANGQWSDVNYRDASVSSWHTTNHLARIRSMLCRYLLPEGKTDKALKQAIFKGVEHWLLQKYTNRNWWYNRIGVPQFWRDILVLAGPELSRAQYDSGMVLLRKYDLLPNFTGANLTWTADLMLHDGLLSKDLKRANKAAAILANEIRITPLDAIQPDYSFLQHGKRLQMHSYGASFLKENMRIAWQLQHTPWQLKKEQINTLTDFVLNGWQWMARGIHNTPATIDREVSRAGSLHKADLKAVLPWFTEIAGKRKPELEALLSLQTGGPYRLTGFRYFPYGDFAAYQQKEVSFFLKTIGPHSEPAESINGENQKGGLLNFGNTYFVKNGNEYFDLMPVWDWRKLPGETILKGGDSLQKNDFTGGISNGEAGFAVMDVSAKKTEGASKLWAFSGGKMICLIAGINKNDSAYTILDQCRLQGKATVDATAGGVLQEGIHTLNNVKWLHHAGLAYIPAGKNNMQVQLKQATGTWSSIMYSGSRDTVRDKVFMPFINHGTDSSTAYMVAAAAMPAQAAHLAENPGFSIVRNSRNIQCLLFEDGSWMAASRQPVGQWQVAGKKILANTPCLLMYDGRKMYAAGLPGGEQIGQIAIDGKTHAVSLPVDGSTVSFAL